MVDFRLSVDGVNVQVTLVSEKARRWMDETFSHSPTSDTFTIPGPSLDKWVKEWGSEGMNVEWEKHPFPVKVSGQGHVRNPE